MAFKHLLRRAALLAVAILLAGVTGVPVFAAPTIHGPTGLIEAPSGDTLAASQFNFALNLGEHVNYLTFNMSPMNNLEFGVTNYGWDGGSEVQGNVKFRLTPESKTAPALAVGVRNIADDHRGLYFAGSKNLADLGMRGHFGIESETGLFLGLSKQLNTVNISKAGRKSSGMSTTFMAELYDSRLNLGATIGITPEVGVNVYLRDMDSAVIGVVYQSRF
jgi:hypothetical protein